MLNFLTADEKAWLLDKTMKAVAKKMPKGEICMMPGCINEATRSLALFSPSTRFASEMFFCDRCSEMIMEAQVAIANKKEERNAKL